MCNADLWSLALQDRRLLITTDKGFTAFRGIEHHGILIVRLRQPNRQKIHDCVMQAMKRFAANDWPGLLAVVRDSTISSSKSSAASDR